MADLPNIVDRGGKKGLLTLRYWVPERFREVEPRKERFEALHTADPVVAMERAIALQAQIEADLNAKLVRRAPRTEREYYDTLVVLASSRGVSYRPFGDIVAGSRDDLPARLLMAAEADPSGSSAELADALVGAAPRPRIMISGLFAAYEAIAKDRVIGKTADQLRVWRNPRLKAARNLLSVIGDKEIAEIRKPDALDFKIWWTERILDDASAASEPGTANKDIYYLGAMIGAILDGQGVEDVRPFFKMKLKDGGGREIEPFDNDWINDHLLCAAPLPKLNREARDVLLAMINTGCRPSELTGLRPEDIILDVEIPYLDINARHRKLKTAASVRLIPLHGVSLEAMKRNREGFPTYRDKYLWSTTVGKFLRESKLLPSDRHRPYSLRHAFEDRLTHAEIPERLAADMMGHEISRERYGAGPSLGKKLEIIRRIAVGGR